LIDLRVLDIPIMSTVLDTMHDLSRDPAPVGNQRMVAVPKPQP